MARSIEDVNANLVSLSNQLQQTRRGGSASTTSQPRRRSRKLGRASSGILHRSASLASVEQSHDDCLDLFDDGSTNRDELKEEKALQSTQLGYEVPDAEAHRQQMAKKIGILLTDERESRRVASLGIVKDSEPVPSDGAARTRRTRAGH